VDVVRCARAVRVRSDASRGARGRVREAAMWMEGWQAGVELSSCRQRYSQDNVLYHGLIVKVCWLPSTVEEGIERCCDCEPHLCVPLAFQSNLKVPRSTRMNCQMWQIKVFPEYHYVTHIQSRFVFIAPSITTVYNTGSSHTSIMDSSHMGLVHQYSASNTQNARPIPTRSQTSPLPPEFEFSLPSVSSVRPGLAKIGRRISEMSDNFLYENDVNPEPLGRSMSVSRKGIPRIQEEKVVPFMGDEPVFCPFCEKPLPPGLLSSHGHHEEEARLTRTPVFGLAPNSTEMTKATSAPETTITNDLKPLMNPLPVTQPPSPAAKEPRMTSVELGKPVRVADEVDNTASKVTIDVEDIRRWAKVAGIELDLPPPPTQTTEPIVEPKPFPKLAPPPEDQGRASSRNASKFGFFGGKSKEGDEDEDSDDDTAGAGGYAKLNGPASPETIEKELAPLEHKERKEVPVAQEADVSAPAPTPASEQEIRDILKEVLSKVNTMVSFSL